MVPGFRMVYDNKRLDKEIFKGAASIFVWAVNPDLEDRAIQCHVLKNTSCWMLFDVVTPNTFYKEHVPTCSHFETF